MFFRIFNGSLFLIIFFTGKVLAVQPGEMFWEIKKPNDSVSNYLIGTQHHLMLNEKSLPLEVTDAIKSARVGLFEIISEDMGKEEGKEAVKNNIKLPLGKTLSLFIGEEKAQKLFSSFQSALSRLDEDIVSSLVNNWKDLDLDITAYSDFNSLKPSVLMLLMDRVVSLRQWELKKKKEEHEHDLFNKVAAFTVKQKSSQIDSQETAFDSEPLDKEISSEISEDKTAQTNHSGISDKTDIQECFQQEWKMDVYIEKTLSCMEKPVYSLESVESQVATLASRTNQKELVDILNISFDRLIALLEERLNEEEIKVLEVAQFFSLKIRGLQASILQNYHQNLQIPTVSFQEKIQKDISKFLTQKQCSILSEISLKKFADHTVNLFELYFQAFVSGKQMKKETEEKMKLLIKEAFNHQRVLISSCFPDYKRPHNQEELTQKAEKLLLNFLKQEIEAILLSRDQNMARKMLPYFEQGGAFAAVGFSHLSGVLEELQAQGYEVKLIEFSTPLKEAELYKDGEVNAENN